MVFAPEWKGLCKSCMSDHFRKRYFKIHDGVDLSNFKPQIMNYSNMAMVWAEIMLHMDVD
jgi:hypothetical protein